MKRIFILFSLAAIFTATLNLPAWSTCSEEMAKLIGFTILAASPVQDEKPEAGGRVIVLDNGMMFWVQLKNPKEGFEHGPVTVVLFRVVSQVPMPVVENRLMIDDDVYFCRRLR